MIIPVDSICAFTLDDGSVVVEMYAETFRIGIIIDKNTDDSGMWLVSNPALVPYSHRVYDLFPPEMLEMFRRLSKKEKPYEIQQWEDDGGR